MWVSSVGTTSDVRELLLVVMKRSKFCDMLKKMVVCMGLSVHVLGLLDE